MKNLAIFDLDNTLINTDSDHSWPQYLIKKGLVDAAETEAQNEKFYRDYQNGCLDIDAFLKFHLAPLARYSKEELAEFHREFMAQLLQRIWRVEEPTSCLAEIRNIWRKRK